MREQYRTRLIRRSRLLLLAIVLGVAWMVLVGEGWFFGLELLDGRTRTLRAELFDNWFFVALAGLGVWLARTLYLLRHAPQMEEARIREEDERNRLIREKAGGLFAPAALSALFLAALVTSFINMTAFETLWWAFWAALALWAGLQIWLRTRM